jgi:predicted metal-dependent phosphoesterase TrpH
MFKIDLHVHTSLGGDSLIEPGDLVSLARLAGLDGVCVTEHHSFFVSAPLEEISVATGFPIVRALEYHAAEGHLLVYGIPASPSDLPRNLPMQHAVDWVHSRGGVAVPAHPYQRDLLGGSLGDRVLGVAGLMALETVNGSLSEEQNQRAREAASRLGVHGVGGSDAHGPPTLGRAYTVFPSPVATVEQLVAALRAGGYSACWNNGRGGWPTVKGP